LGEGTKTKILPQISRTVEVSQKKVGSQQKSGGGEPGEVASAKKKNWGVTNYRSAMLVHSGKKEREGNRRGDRKREGWARGKKPVRSCKYSKGRPGGGGRGKESLQTTPKKNHQGKKGRRRNRNREEGRVQIKRPEKRDLGGWNGGGTMQRKGPKGNFQGGKAERARKRKKTMSQASK